jgi:hypothetical protein
MCCGQTVLHKTYSTGCKYNYQQAISPAKLFLLLQGSGWQSLPIQHTLNAQQEINQAMVTISI